MEPLGVLEGDKHPQVIWTRQGRIRQTPRRLWLIILFCSASLAAADNALLFGSLWAPSNEILGDKRISPGPIWVYLALCVGVTIRMVRLISAFSGLHQVMRIPIWNVSLGKKNCFHLLHAILRWWKIKYLISGILRDEGQ